ncbi:MAG: hypothetical protein H0X14_03895 [Acidobacteria bacterium]|nr:hypothetical protein [Acidobacteriota bacterium]
MIKHLPKVIIFAAFILTDAISEIHVASGPRASQPPVNAEAGRRRTMPHKDIRLEVRGGSLVLKGLTLNERTDSTILRGFLVNKTNRMWTNVIFEILAYDKNGDRIKGVEEENIFKVQQLGKGATVPINSGYGMWLQGIRIEDISRLEVVFAKGESPRAHHVNDLEIEE